MPALPTRRLIYLFVAVFISLSVSVQAGTFKNPVLIDTSYDPTGIATADLNRDGKIDVVYVDGSSPRTLHVLLSNGNGTFSDSQDIALPDGTCSFTNCSINLGDVTHDGNTDVVLGGAVDTTGQVVVLPGNGNGTFQSPIVSTVINVGSNGGTPFLNGQMGIGDVNGDGAADLTIGDQSSATLYVLLGDNTGKFSVGSKSTYYFTGQTFSYLYDLNGDGHLDIVINDLSAAQTYVLLGKGNGTFKPAVVYVSFALSFVDMDGDGHPDLLASVYPGQIEVLKGNPDGTFGTASVVTTVPTEDLLVGAGDFNGDGIADLIFVTPAGVGIALGKGNLTYDAITSSVAGSVIPAFYQLGASQGDFNLDGHADLAMAVNGGVLILHGNGDGTFVSGDSYDVGHAVGTVSVADFNGDHAPDIAATVPATYPRLLLGNGAGKFALGTDQNQTYGSPAPSLSMSPADFNGDGKSDLDILELTQAFPYGQPFVLLGNGSGTFATPVAIATGPAFIADLNRDSRSDLVTQSNNLLQSLLGQANGTFTQVTTPLIHPTSGIAGVGDLNHDGKPDLVVFEYPSLRAWLGNGDGTFTQSGLAPDPDQPINAPSATVADIDGDGNGDIIVVPYPNELGLPFPLLIYYGNGDGTFQDVVLLPVSHAYTQLVVADVNRDNKPDLVLSDGGGIAVIANRGGRIFAPEEHFVAGRNISGLSVVDVNGDGFPDIVAANAGGTTVAVLLNEPNGNGGDGAPSDGTFTISPEPSQYGAPVTLSITMSAPSGPVPTGSVSFSVDGSFITTVPLTNGTGHYSFAGLLNTGTQTFVATYEGDNTYAAESFSILHVVLPPIYATQTLLVAAPTIAYTSQTVRLTATVSSVVPVPAGVVTFLDGTKTLGAKTIYNEDPVVLLDTNLLTAGTHSITAVYQGYQDPFNQQAIFQPSTSVPVTVTVNTTATTTTLQASTTSPTAGTVVTFSSKVASAAGTPFGGVTFYDGTIPLGTSSLLDDGSCKFNTASLSPGTHSVTAVYNANATFAGSMSPAVIVTVTAAGANLSSTVVTLAATGSGDKSAMVAKVRALSGLPIGEVIFLDGGNILGSAATDGSGTASLPVQALAGGTHNLSASFSGAPQFAPGASPGLLEQFPDSGVGFSLTVAADTVDVTGTGSQPLLVTVIPSMDFRQQVQLSCTNGVPSGYECSFSPASLYSGDTYLQIRPSSNAFSPSARPAWVLGTTLGILSFLLIGTGSRRVRWVALMACLSFAMLTGCGGSSNSPAQPQVAVLSIRAMAGTGGNATVHSAQVLLHIRSSK